MNTAPAAGSGQRRMTDLSGVLRQRLARVLLLVPLAFLPGCSEPETVREDTILAFGTMIDVTLWGADQQTAERAFTAVRGDFAYMHTTWHAWRPSAVGRINELLATGAEFTVAPSVLPLILSAHRLYTSSGGLFNPAIGRLVALWGFHGDEYQQAQAPPSPEAIAKLVAQDPGMDDMVIDGITLRGKNPAVHLDFGGFAKGYGIDQAVAHLRELGIQDAIVNAGGDLRAIGSHGERPWRIGVRHPDGEGVLASLETRGDESVFTSGDYERFFIHEGRRYHHLIDPRTGYPATGTRSVTVIHSDAATADAAATALFVAGPDAWYEVAQAMGIGFVMLLDARGTLHMNPAMAERVRIETQPPPPIQLSEPL